MKKLQNNNLERGKYMSPLFVIVLFFIPYIVLTWSYGRSLKELEESYNNLNGLHDNYVEISTKKYDNVTKFYENVITLKDMQINKNLNEISKLKKEINMLENNLLLPLGEFEATAYDLSIQSCGKPKSSRGYGITTNGTSIARHSRESAMTIAVDPNIIPLGTKVYIEFPEQFKYLNGIYTANDTGSAIKGKVIDVFMGDFQQDTTSETVWEFGRRKVKVYKVLNEKNK